MSEYSVHHRGGPWKAGYLPGPGMDYRDWGPKAWGFMHACTFAYPAKANSEQRKQMHDFLISAGHVLPCKVCSVHFLEFAKKTIGARGASAPMFAGNQALARWLVAAHNDVNKTAGKPLWSFEDVQKLYVIANERPATPPEAHDTWTAPPATPQHPASPAYQARPSSAARPASAARPSSAARPPSAARPAAAARPPSAASRGSDRPVAPGMFATIKGLKARPDLNGQMAYVESFKTDSQRFEVNFNGEGLLLSPSNLATTF